MTNSAVYAIGDAYLDAYVVLDPIAATDMGVGSHVDTFPDLTPNGHAARNDLARATLHELAATPPTTDRDRVAADLMNDRLQVSVDQFELGEHLRDLRTLGCAMQDVRGVFDLMPYEDNDDWACVARRMHAVPAALRGLRASLEHGRSLGIVAAQRQVRVCAQQAATWGGTTPSSTQSTSSRTDTSAPFFHALAAKFNGDQALQADIAEGARIATHAFGEFAAYLTNEYLPGATDRDAVGRDRYAVAARAANGIELDLEETYEWGWDELHRIESQMRIVCERIVAGASFAEVVDHLERDPAHVVIGEGELQRWLQDLIDRTTDELNGTHFDIAPIARTCEAMIAPPGGAAAMYYTPPSEDFSRPGRTWYPTQGATRFPTWKEVSICYHEAVPGHHLQLAQVRLLADELSRYQRLMGWVSGHGEGWALYAERLMGELGYLDNPAHELGMLAAQAMRAVRVIVDIGMHLELKVPDREPGIGGMVWNAAIALPFVIERSCFPESWMRSEVDRYLGLPGQAISYKVGERVWLQARDDAKRRHGASFDLKAWHAFALNLGAVGLSTLEAELARF